MIRVRRCSTWRNPSVDGAPLEIPAQSGASAARISRTTIACSAQSLLLPSRVSAALCARRDMEPATASVTTCRPARRTRFSGEAPRNVRAPTRSAKRVHAGASRRSRSSTTEACGRLAERTVTRRAATAFSRRPAAISAQMPPTSADQSMTDSSTCPATRLCVVASHGGKGPLGELKTSSACRASSARRRRPAALANSRLLAVSVSHACAARRV